MLRAKARSNLLLETIYGTPPDVHMSLGTRSELGTEFVPRKLVAMLDGTPIYSRVDDQRIELNAALYNGKIGSYQHKLALEVSLDATCGGRHCKFRVRTMGEITPVEGQAVTFVLAEHSGKLEERPYFKLIAGDKELTPDTQVQVEIDP
jgi:hypothetical protein